MPTEDLHMIFTKTFLPMFDRLYSNPATRSDAVKVSKAMAVLDQTLADYQRVVSSPSSTKAEREKSRKKTLQVVEIYKKLFESALTGKGVDDYIALLQEKYKGKFQIVRQEITAEQIREEQERMSKPYWKSVPHPSTSGNQKRT